MLKIKYLENANPELAEFVSFEFKKYEAKNGVTANFKQFNIVAEKYNTIVGILSGRVFYTEINIDEIIVLEQFRGEGIGRKLIEKLEGFYEDKEFETISLTTYQFQAFEFYKKCGYQLEFIRENKNNPKFTKYFFVKYIRTCIQKDQNTQF
ncbi:MAG: GNAT family N-acetyltransferase [Oscillospiraceae bacterium]|jgi:ribosomal protein S18 acetylase RimI-like enzyme|nr:GNAT family N-acetyltransferase [Oscillospiraceae bacterium]